MELHHMMNTGCVFLLSLVLIQSLDYSTSEGCSGRVVLNATSGFISDGVGNYPAPSHCEWLIDGNGSKYITLKFRSMKTECSYDYLFVYDGNSYSDNLLGSFSGQTLPDTVVATTGYMLIYFYSDRNYVLEGFEADYYLSECLYNCSGHGTCNNVTNTCTCDMTYFGDGCQYSICAQSCSENGYCLPNGYLCRCNDGFIGDQCQLAINSTESQSTWYNLVEENDYLTSRTGHSGVFIPSENSFYVFGGNTLNMLLDDLVKFDFSPSFHRWSALAKTSPWPSARHEHAMARVGDNFYTFGGILSDGSHSNELWFYKTSNNRWYARGTFGTVKPPGLASHTLTLVEDKWLYLFGGRTDKGEFSSAIYRIDTENDDEWERVVERGGKEADRRLVGHTTVYHKESKSLLVFGGFLPDYARFPKRMNFLHTYHTEENYWSQIFYEAVDNYYPPKDRSYHSANIMGNYMVVFGGNSHIHHDEEICYDNEIYFYHLGCHRWINYKKMAEAFPGTITDSAPGKGRFSHVADVAFDNTLLVVGGYRGNVLGDMIAYTVPKAVAKNWNDSMYASNRDHCDEYSKYEYCKFDPECVWCMKKPDTQQPGCMHRSKTELCVGAGTRQGNCPGICSALHDCGSCTVQGQGADLTHSTNTGLFQNEKCAWCVKEAQCQRLSVPQGVCNPDEGTNSGLEGWWGANSSRPTSLDKCRLEDYPAGLHWIKYKYPADWEHPDEVEIQRITSINFQFDPLFDAENIDGTEYTAKFQGYIHPLNAESANGPPLKVFLVSVAAHAWLYISLDDTPENKELVAELDIITFETLKALRNGYGEQVFPDPSRGKKYYMEQIAIQDIAGRSATPIAATMQLEWTGALKVPSRIRETFTSEFLEPYNSGVCSHYTSCLACMTDTSCGWCVTSSSCALKTAVELPAGQCGAVAGARNLIIVPTDCPICADHITCQTCTQDSLCEWLTPEARCLRRGRFSESVNNTAQCPIACQERYNCSSCLSERNECAWCEQTDTCFPFVEYMMRYAYGKCTQWVDNMEKSPQCHDCSRHSSCKECLADFQCGWCGNDDNPTLGRCLHGDFTGPEIGGNCSELVAEEFNVSSDDAASWSYGNCPDVEECRLELDDCHENATCINTFDSYICECNRGYTGNGKDTCNRTCYYDCMHGVCSEAPEFTCNCTVGWTGVDCNTNCGCNNHSTCLTGLGVCDECQHWTTGEHCEFCKQGSYGDATAMQGCLECDCNGHGDDTEGVCNSTTGVCFCKDNTQGDHCDQCVDGYYGNPTDGAKCYLKCEGRTILGNIKYGALGTHAGEGVVNEAHAYCLWILTVHPDLTNLRLINVVPTITFTMQTDIKTRCSRDYVYVYDGIPSFMTSGSSSSATLLAAYCGFGLDAPLSVEAKSGYLTVYFEGNIEPSSSSTRGFNATYHVNTCPSDCGYHRSCDGNKCICSEGWGGINCEIELCPKNCSFNMGQGVCDLDTGICSCSNGYTGLDCSKIISPNVTFYSTLLNPWRQDGIDAFNNSLARMGHTLVTCDGDTFFMFGGYSLSQAALNDLWKFDATTETWTQLLPATNDEPGPRYHHAAVCVPTVRSMFVFGGINGRGVALKEMWKFSLDSNRWSRLNIEDPDEDDPIPAVSGHTLSLVDDTKLWLIGGFSSPDYFNEMVYEYDASDNSWREMDVSGSTPTGLYGHSAVFHESSNTIYVFGGFEYLTDKTIASANLYALDITRPIWSLLSPEEGNRQTERYFHTAVTTEHYMLILGGRTSMKAYDNSVLAYRFKCNHWTNLSPYENGVLGEGVMSVIGPAALSKTNTDSGMEEVYFMAGFNTISQAVMTKMTVPQDLCQLIQDKDTCLVTLGCAACQDETNKTYCFSNESPAALDCALAPNLSYYSGTVCNIERIEERDCSHHTTCTECLAQWPIHRDHSRVCQWCSNCPTGKCIPKNDDCEQANYCRRQQRAIISANDCVERLCQASDCEKCWKKSSCIWTRQFKRSSEVGRTLSLIPIYDWNCVVKSLLDATPYMIESSPPKTCPMRCYQYTTCKDCLNSLGGEGGAQKCVWSVPLQECMPPAYLELHCSNGECGHILSGEAEQCPENCSIHTQCSKCLSTPGCGWCAFGGLNGKGVCMEGGLTGPNQGFCSANNVTNGTEPLSQKAAEELSLSTEPPSWSFGKCPPENECENNHHTCDDSENCTDLDVGFKCECKTGYIRDSSHKCKPDCKQRCEPNGDCVAPDVCKCHFGYVGHNCTTECLCNKHSNCKSVAERDICLDCQNNTQGAQCQECKPLYVGNPVNGGECRSCKSFCNQHSDICVSKGNYQVINNYNSHLDPNYQPLTSNGNLSFWSEPGPPNEESAICLHCSGNTMGEQCDSCQDGFFRKPDETTMHDCYPCQCQGHSNVCDANGGKNCDCKNNTKSPRCDNGQNLEKPCYELQCTECIDNFMGKPIDGHQCYRQMSVDRDYCFDPSTQMNCHTTPGPLHKGRTVFFVVQPKYLNVDIRIILDVTKGGVDVYFTSFDDTYTINVDSITGLHNVSIDPKYKYAAVEHLRSRRDVSSSVNVQLTEPDNGTENVHMFETHHAVDFNSFITLLHPDTFLLIKDVKDRLVITLPNDIHRLKITRFYIVLQAVGSATDNETYGNIFFRQDQPHIDLFVFFSVFFSNFFLFLAICVMLWKLKQAVDARQSRQRRQQEMQHMASRPFSKADILIEPELPELCPPPDHLQNQPSQGARKGAQSIPKLSSKYSLNSNSNDPAPLEDKGQVRHIALEPTDDGIAAIGTVFIQLPGGTCSPVRACLGSSLVQGSRVLLHSVSQPPKNSVYIRRRGSVSA